MGTLRLNPGPSACEADGIPLHHVPHYYHQASGDFHGDLDFVEPGELDMRPTASRGSVVFASVGVKFGDVDMRVRLDSMNINPCGGQAVGS
eukprot:1744478-Amphidinium_carterae.2